jgi:hypothetical protein
MTMGTIIKVSGNSREVVKVIDVDDLYSASMEALAEAIKANKKGKGVTYLTKFLIAQGEKIHGGYYARGLQYTES